MRFYQASALLLSNALSFVIQGVDLTLLGDLNLLPPAPAVPLLYVQAYGQRNFTCDLASGNFTLHSASGVVSNSNGKNWGYLVTEKDDDNTKVTTWRRSDGKYINIVALRRATSPFRAGATMHWVLSKRRDGDLEDFTYVVRAYTVGGTYPSKNKCTEEGKSVSIGYSAKYLFFGPPKDGGSLTSA